MPRPLPCSFLLFFSRMSDKVVFGMAFSDRIRSPSIHTNSSLDCLPCFQSVQPSLNIFVLLELQKIRSFVVRAEAADPGEDGNVRDRVFVVADVLLVFQMLVQYVNDTLGLHRETIDGVLDLDRGVFVKVSETASEVRRGPHLPHKPVDAFGLFARVGGEKLLFLLCQIQQNRSRFEKTERLAVAIGYGVIEESGDLRVWIDIHEGRSELLKLHNIDGIGIVVDSEFF
mmetsp:Transcript_22690/g.53808  ORF Transcript_22690/g.53808 Transcript_22690/m.53808 type:complete len:228 (+) Transcript_22690:78-761(+)